MFLRMVIRARSVQKKLERLKRAKERGVIAHLQDPPGPAASEEEQRPCERVEGFLLRAVPCRQPVRDLLADIRDERTLTHFVVKSLAGFLAGVLLTYLVFLVLVGQLGMPLPAATRWSCFAAVGLTLGLAFSSRVRCFVLLVLPQLCSARGRQALLGYALILTLAGPASNALGNARVLADSLRCGQDRMRGATRRVLELVAQPLRALGDAVKRVLSNIKQAVRTIRSALLAVKKAVMAVYHGVKAAFDWLSGVVSVCNKTIGTPFQRCTRALEQSQTDCLATLGSFFGWMCSPLSVIKTVCYTVKFLDYICDLFELVTNVVVDSVKRNDGKTDSFRQVARDIGEDIRGRSEALLGTFGFLSGLLGLCFLLVPLRAWIYRHSFLTKDHFDNRFVTKAFRQLDWNRARQGRETVLPLTIKEQSKYITVWTPRLSASEKVRVVRSLGVVLSAAAKMAIFITADYFLYWMLAIVNMHGQFKAHIDVPPHLGVRVNGDGAIAELYRSVVETFEPAEEKWDLDSVPCLPRPHPPDLPRYVQILSVPALCVALAALEPYVLRARHAVMSCYHPDRADERAVWLYNHVLRARLSLAKLLRRQARRALGDTKAHEERVTLLEWVRARCPMSRVLLGSGKRECCVLCAAPERAAEPLERCASPGCAGRYCHTCYAEMGRLCPACKQPAQYGDLSDVSEELGSSDTNASMPVRKDSSEQLGPKRNNKKKKRKRKKTKKRRRKRNAEPRDWDALLARRRTRSSSSSSESSSACSFSYQLGDPVDIGDPADLQPRWPRFHDVEAQLAWDPATLDQLGSSGSETETVGGWIGCDSSAMTCLQPDTPLPFCSRTCPSPPPVSPTSPVPGEVANFWTGEVPSPPSSPGSSSSTCPLSGLRRPRRPPHRPARDGHE